MSKFTTYQIRHSYDIRQYTHGPQRNTKLNFTSENFTADDRYFFFTKQVPSDDPDSFFRFKSELWKAEVATGEAQRVAGSEYRGFALDRHQNYGVAVKDNIVYRYECDTDEFIEVGALPEGGRITLPSHYKPKRHDCSGYQQWNCIYGLVTLDPKTGKSEVVYQSDYNLGHVQVCPTDDNLLFFIHETGGDALQRMWI